MHYRAKDQARTNKTKGPARGGLFRITSSTERLPLITTRVLTLLPTYHHTRNITTLTVATT